MTAKGPGEARAYDGSGLRIGIIHSRWNTPIISALVAGAQKALLAAGVSQKDITIQSVPGSYELPLACQRMHAASTASTSTQLVSAATDLLSSASSTDLANTQKADGKGATGTGGPLDAIIAIGVLIKGKTMHFEYIADAVSHGLMKVQLDTACPVIFGLLTCLDEQQAMTRAGLKSPSKATPVSSGGADPSKQHESFDGEAGLAPGANPEEGGGLGKALQYGEQGHNHGEDWGSAAVEMGCKRRAWGDGRFLE